MRYVWDEEDQEYEDEEGNVVTEAALLALINLLAGKVSKRLSRIIAAEREGSVDPRTSQGKAEHEIRMSHRMMAALGAGGLRQLTETQKAQADRTVMREQTYWVRLSMSVNTVSDAEAEARAAQYGSATYQSFQHAAIQAHAAAGYDEARRILEHGAAHCEGCVEAANAGWVPVDQLLPIGDADCLSNCRCSVDYRQSSEARAEAA